MKLHRLLPLCMAALVTLLLIACGGGQGSTTQRDSYLTTDQVKMINKTLSRIEPTSRIVCQKTIPNENCNLTAFVAPGSDNTINAYQVRGKPVILFTEAILAEFKNQDEFAFVYAHEAAHYILQHGKKRQAREVIGALLFGGLAAANVTDATYGGENVSDWAEFGYHVGNRLYSPQEELEADRLGADIAAAAGFNPVNGIKIFERLGDSPATILPSHPRNNKRIAEIKKRYNN